MPIVNEPAFWPVLGLIILALGLTIYIFRRGLFERGDRKGVAAHPGEVRRQNSPRAHVRSGVRKP